MNKKILISVSVIALVAAIGIGGTIAFFSDTETSTGNTFTAGSIDLKIGNDAWFNGQPQSQFTWELSDLTNQLFFNYTDLKPGDWEEDTISIRVDDNPSWVCANLTITKDSDVTCTEPEVGDDPNCATGNDWNGELGKELSFIFWADDGDNVLEDNEQVVLSGSPSDLPSGDGNPGQTFPIVDSQFNLFGTNGQPLPGQTTVHIGKAFCFGTLLQTPVAPGPNSPSDNPGFTCDGELVNNASQSDSVMGNMSFTAVQSRNNANFVCGN
ncbi:hypothetical protein IH779_03135 [Patescibacteria group bacterium]|nr:hypothetical protein [Patescibacteria group bacterium]